MPRTRTTGSNDQGQPSHRGSRGGHGEATECADGGNEPGAGRIRPERLLSVPATEIAREHLGRPLPNAVLLGAFAAFTGVVSLESVDVTIRRRFDGPIGDRNAAGAGAAYRYVRKKMEASIHA